MHQPRLLAGLDGDKGRIDYYDQHALSYVEATRSVDMSALYDRFLRHVPSGGVILDAGSGSGRDTLAFAERGYLVEAFDASPRLCELSTKLTGVQTRLLRFQDFESLPRYDGIWACASLLHVPAEELQDSIDRLVRALQPGGVLYASFKHGTGGRIADDGRFYLDMDEQHLRPILARIHGIERTETWVSSGEGSHQGKDYWLNALVHKQADGGPTDG